MIKIDIEKKHGKKKKIIELPKGSFYSDWFQCQKCGYATQMKVEGDTATCYLCGGLMKRK